MGMMATCLSGMISSTAKPYVDRDAGLMLGCFYTARMVEFGRHARFREIPPAKLF